MTINELEKTNQKDAHIMKKCVDNTPLELSEKELKHTLGIISLSEQSDFFSSTTSGKSNSL